MRLDLTTSVVEDYYHNKNKRLEKILEKISSIESWTKDSSISVLESVAKLTEALNEAPEYKIMENSEELLKILAYLSCSKAFFFMTWLDENFKKDLSVDFIEKAKECYDDSPEFSLHVERVDTAKKINIIGDIFSQERAYKIIKILDSIKEDINGQEEYEFYN